MLFNVKIYHWYIGIALLLIMSWMVSRFNTSELNPSLVFAIVFGSTLLLLIVLLLIIAIRLGSKRTQQSLVRINTAVFYSVIVIFSLLTWQFISYTYQLKQQELVDRCVADMREKVKKNPALDRYDFYSFCECVLEKSKSLNTADTAWMSDPSAIKSIELYGDCLSSSGSHPVYEGINSSMPADTLNLIDEGSVFKVKVTVNGREIYLILDSGASDIILPKSFVLDSDSNNIKFTGKTGDYQLVDGSKLNTEEAIIAEFQIGNFVLKDVKVSLADNIPQPLLGKSLLDQFSSWTVYQNKKLILTP
ncbi:hypothetical protein GYB22_03990 [bacterium]|nr:hypothetical protein [bacterium]